MPLSFQLRHLIGHLLFIAAIFASPVSLSAADDARLWTAIKNGQAFVVMRHALAPGTGDPENFSVADCTTQRNLSREGRDQARKIGQRFRTQGIAAA